MTGSAPKLTAMDVITPPCRLAFPALFVPRKKAEDSDKLTYQAAILIPAGVDLKPFQVAMASAMAAKWGKPLVLPAAKNPIRDCDTKAGTAGYEPGWHYINASSGRQPLVVDQRRQPIIDQKLIYPGCWCHFHVTAYAWEHPKSGKGVSFSLTGVQLVKDDERLDGRVSSPDVFPVLDGGAADTGEDLFR